MIGYVGSTGLATGPHLCYRFWKHGKQVDPFLEKLPPAFPVKKENKQAYQRVIENFKPVLDEIPIHQGVVTLKEEEKQEQSSL